MPRTNHNTIGSLARQWQFVSGYGGVQKQRQAAAQACKAPRRNELCCRATTSNRRERVETPSSPFKTNSGGVLTSGPSRCPRQRVIEGRDCAPLYIYYIVYTPEVLHTVILLYSFFQDSLLAPFPLWPALSHSLARPNQLSLCASMASPLGVQQQQQQSRRGVILLYTTALIKQSNTGAAISLADHIPIPTGHFWID